MGGTERIRERHRGGGTAGIRRWSDRLEKTGTFRAHDFVGQARQCLKNTLAVLAEAGAEHVVRMTWFITDREEYLANLEGIGQVYRELMGRHFPAMTMVEVPALIGSEAKVEVETTAVVPSDPRRAVEAG